MRIRLMLAFALALVLTAPPVRAASDPGLRCLNLKLKTAGRGVYHGLACHTKAARDGLPVDAACLANATAGLSHSYARVEATGSCLADDGSAALAAEVSRAVAVIANSLRPQLTASSCQGSKVGAASRRARESLKAHGRLLKQGDRARLQESMISLRTKFADRFARAEGKNDCLTSGDTTRVAGTVDAAVDGIDAVLRVTAQSTETRTSPVTPADTPGTAGVTVTNPKLITQFGGASFSLNNVTWTRWRLNGPAIPPDAVLVNVPGFGGGAGNFEVLAENLITRMLEDHGLLVEVWGYDRRTEQLEDRAGMLTAGSLGDPLVALDWFYGNELGLTLSPSLTRRAVFYNKTDDVPFLANWTPLVFSRDIDVVIAAANTASGGNAFLGGHSAGTGFAARYAATDFNLTGVGPADPGYAKLRGLVMFEGGGGTTATAALTADSLDRIEAKADGGLFGAVRNQVGLCADASTSCTVATQATNCIGQVPATCSVPGRCVDGLTACTIANEATDCSGQMPPKCTLPTNAHGVILGISPPILAAAEPAGVQALSDPDTGQAILQVDQGAPGNNVVAQVPELSLLGILPAATVDGLFGSFLDDDGLLAASSAAVATSLGATGPTVGGLVTWASIDERALFPPCPGATCPTPDNGVQPTTLPGSVWGQEKEVTRIDRLRGSFAGIEGANASDWYYPLSGLSTTSIGGVCTAGICSVGNVGASCATNSDCSQVISLDSTALSVGRGRRDIENLTQAANVNVPVLCVGGSNGLTPVPGRFTALAQSFGVCTATSCTGADPRVVDASMPNPAFPTFGGVAGGFEVVIAPGFAHVDVVSGEDDADNPVLAALADFIARNVQ